MIGLGGFDELGLRDIQSILLEGGQGGGAVLDGRADTGIEGAVTLGLQVLDDLVLVHLGGDQEACCEGIHAGDVGAEQILGGEGGTTRLGVEVQTTVRADLAFGEDFPHNGGGLVQVGRELIHIPADELVALVGVEGAEHAGLAGGADLVLVGVAGQVGVVAFEVQLHEVDVVGLKEGDGGGCIEVILVHRRFLGLRLDQELGVQTDLLSILVAHVEELGHVRLFALHLRVPQVLVAFTSTPEHVVLGTQALGDLQGVLQLAAGVRVDVGERGGGGAGDEARVGEQGGGVPQQLDAGGLHVLFDLVDDLVQVLVGLAQGVAFRSDVAIMEAEVLDAELLEELEGVVDLGQGLVLRIGILAVPRTLGGAGAERIDELLVEGVPPCDAETQPVLHLLAGNDLVGIVVMEGKTLLRPLFATDVRNLIDIPQTHGMLLCLVYLRKALFRSGLSARLVLHNKLNYLSLSIR